MIGQVDQVEELLRKTAQPLPSSDQTCGGVSGSQTQQHLRLGPPSTSRLPWTRVWHAGTLSGRGQRPPRGSPSPARPSPSRATADTLTQQTAADGATASWPAPGRIQVQAAAFGYAAQTVSGRVSQPGYDHHPATFALGNATTGQHLRHGDSRAARPTPVQGATVALVGADLAATTAADGTYTLANVPPAHYTARVTSPGFQDLSASVTVDGAETLNFAPSRRRTMSWATAATPARLTTPGSTRPAARAYDLADDASVASVTLPWSFTFYGNSYSTLYVSSNGFVSFRDRLQHVASASSPSKAHANNQIIGLGEDLNPAGGTQGKSTPKIWAMAAS